MKHSILKRVSLFLILAFVISMAAGCSSRKSGDAGSADQKAIKIGSKNFTESLILGEIYALALEDKGFKVERVFDIASSVYIHPW